MHPLLIARASLALFALLVLPGLALSRRVRLGRFDRALFILAVSLGANAWLALLLAILGLYTRTAAFLLVLVWIVVFIVEWRPLLARRRIPARPDAPRGGRSTGGTLGYLFLLVPLALVAWLTLFFPIVDFDGMASWNRWARDLFLEPHYLSFAGNSFFYPLLHPAATSFVYQLLGTLHAERAAHALALAYTLILLLAMDATRRHLGDRSMLALLAVFGAAPIAQFAPTMYADVPSAAFETLAVLLLLEAATAERPRDLGLAAAAGGACALSALMKQAGLVPLGVLPLASLLLPGRRLQRSLVFLAAGVLLLLPWTLAPNVHWWSEQGTFLTREIHGDAGYLERIVKAARMILTGSALVQGLAVNVVAVAAVVAAALASLRRGRPYVLLFSLAVAHSLVWMLFYSYDLRLLMPVYPLLLLGASRGAGDAVEWCASRVARARRAARAVRSWTGLLFGVPVLLLFLGFVWEEPGSLWFQYTQYRGCMRVDPLALSSRQLHEAIIPGMSAVYAWREKWPLRSPNRYWAPDPRLLPYFDDGAVDGRAAHLLPNKGQENGSWRPGDLLLVPAGPLTAPESRAWLAGLVARGRVRPVGEAGGGSGFVVE